MAIVKRFNELLDLDEIDVLIDETDKSRHIIVSDLPDSLPQGKSSFLIELSPFMKDGVEIQMDFIDNEGASIYLEPVSEYLEGTARRVSAEVYGDTAPGIATLIIVGELESVPEDTTIFSDVDPVPVEYQGAYNIRLTKQVVINPTAVNTQIIKFFDQPKINVSEIRKGTMVRSEVTGSKFTPEFNVEGTPTDSDLLFKPHGAIDNDIKQGSGGTASPKKQRNIKAYIESRKRKNKKGLRKNSAFKRSGLLSKTNSPATFPYQLRIGEFDGAESFRFNTAHIGGSVTFFESDLGNTFTNSNFYPSSVLSDSGIIDTPTFDTLKEQGIINVSASMYTASIVDLINDKTAVVELPFTNKNNNGENIILPIFAKAKIAYENMPTGSYAAANLVSYADVKLSNMRTFSGDVYKVKVYVKSEGGFDDYKLLSEVPLESKELLVDTESIGQAERTGYVILQSEIDKYWDIFGNENGLTAVTDASITASYSNSTILDAIELSSSIALSDDSSKHIRFQLKDEYKFDMVNGMDYSISFTAVGKKIKPTKEAVMLVYVSGSAMKQSDKLYFDEGNSVYVPESNKYGRRIGALSVKASDDETVNFGLVNQPFSNDLGGDGVLQFRVLSGIWNISDMSIAPAADTGFSPSFFQFSQQIPAELSHKRPDTFEFLAEFYDVNNNIADTVAYNAGILFDGANMSISGKDNVLESNMFIGGDNTGSGMHLGGVTSTLPETGKDGATGSGFMRSVGYQGFISASAQSGSYGFMIYSGSVLPDSGDNYKGVGLELVGESGSLKFRTNPSVFEVLADAFFVGNKDLQFISGSTGNIEISSSDFHLTPEGNVTASAILLGDKGGGNYLQFVNDTLTVVGSLSVNNLFLPAIIDGETSTVLNASSSLDSNGFAKFVSASIGGFDVNSVAIKSADGSLILSGSGQVTGSTVKFIGGDIGGWKLSESTIQGGNLILGKDGSIKSSDYVSDFSGFIITAEENGYAEFENCKIRGTMATTTFEKESVNAVGGQLFVANSAALSGSAVAATEVSMSLKNVTGFAKGEVLLIKKVTDTGFNTEYVKVVSSSRVNAGGDSDPDGLAGNILVQRGNGYYTRKELKYYGADASTYLGFIGFRSSNTDPVVTDLKFNTGVSAAGLYANGTNTGIHVSGSHVSSGSFYVNVTGSVVVGDGTSLSLRLLNNTDSDSVIGTLPFWNTADGAGPIEKELYFPSGVATGSKIKMQVVGVTDSTNDAFLKLEHFTASLDYGSIGSVGTGDSGSVGDPIGGPTNYTEGQVVVSTGRYISGTGNNTVGTGYIRLNANPKNKATPYMDIVERTGSGIYDVELKARLGDLSGVAGTRNVPAGFQGFGLMSEVAFLSGSNIKLEAPTFLLGDKNQNFVSGSEGNIEISSSKFHIDSQTEKFFVGQPNRTGSYIDFQGSAGTLAISASNFELTTDGQITASSMQLRGKSVIQDVAVADYFAFRNIEITTSNYTDYLVEQSFTNNSGTKTGWILYLDGSRGGDMGMMVTLNNLDAIAGSKPDMFPIIAIIPPSQVAAGTAPPTSGAGAGHRIIIEARNSTVHFCRNNGSTSNTDAVTTSGVNGGYFFACDADDPYFFGFSSTRQVDGGSTYKDCLEIQSGTRIEFARSNTDFKIQSLSSLTKVGLSVPAAIATFNVKETYLAGDPVRAPAPFMFAGGWNSNFQGTIMVTPNHTAVMKDDGEAVANNGAALSSTNYASASITLQYANANFLHVGGIRGSVLGTAMTSPALGLGAFDTKPADKDYPLIVNESHVLTSAAFNHNPYEENIDFQVSAVASPSKGPLDGQNMIRVDAARGVVGIGCNPGGDGAEGVLGVHANYAGYMARFFNDGDNENRFGIEIQVGADDGAGSTGLIKFSDGNGDSIGSIVNGSGTIAYNAFTGAHLAKILKSESDTTSIYTSASGSTSGSVYPNGTVVSMVSSSFDSKMSNQPLHWVVSSSAHQDKRVFGVYTLAMPWGTSGSRHDGTIDELEKDWRFTHSIASVGDGFILASNQGGDIEIGDYLTTASGSGGYARKQSDDLLHNYTVAKANMPVDWDDESETTKLIACTYHCG